MSTPLPTGIFKQQILSDWMIVAAVISFFLEGAARKWLIEDGSDLMYVAYFSKDAFILISLLLHRKPIAGIALKYQSILIISIPLTIAGCGISAVSNLQPQGAIMTVRSLVVLPVAACLMVNNFSERRLYLVSITFICMMILNVPLAVTQFFAPSTSFINKYVGETNLIATAGYSTRVRATGTFSYIGGLGIASVISVAFGILLIQIGRDKFSKISGFLGIICGIATSLTTISRGTVLGVAGLLFFVAFTSNHKALVILLSVAAIVVFLLGYENDGSVVGDGKDAGMVQEIFTAVYQRNLSAGDSIVERMLLVPLEAVEYLGYFPFGYGLGFGQGAAVAVTGVFVVETEWARIVLETGGLGLAGFFLTYCGAITILLFGLGGVKKSINRQIMFACIGTCCVLFFGGVAFNHQSSIAFWSLAVVGMYFAERDVLI